jgi:hypothetical protein
VTEASATTAHTRWKRLAIGLLLVAACGVCLDRTCANYLTFNPRAMSSEGKAAARCLSSSLARTCQWNGWKNWEQIKGSCPQATCMASVLIGRRYALKRVGADSADVVAVGVHTYDGMLGDTWLGVDGTPLHCVDATYVPSPPEEVFRGTQREVYVARDVNPRCAAIEVPSIEALRLQLERR